MFLVKYFWLPLLFFTGACTPMVAAIRQPANVDDSAVLYLYRPASMSNVVISPLIVLDNGEGFEIKNDSYTFIKLEPGVHRVELQLTQRYQGEHLVSLHVQPGHAYYLRVATQMKFRKNDLYLRRFDLQPVSPEMAQAEIAQCSFFSLQADQQSVGPDDADTPVKVPVEAEFSISKSRDPFSRNR